MTKLQVARIEPATTAEGPGLRLAIWVQGCSIGCVGCCNPHTWELEAGLALDVDDVIAQLVGSPVEGITLLGGEPFDQAPALAELAAAARGEHLGVITFTGYRYETLRVGRVPGWLDLLSMTDLLVDGPYVERLRDTSRPLVGSANQRFIHLTDRYRGSPMLTDRVELRIRRDGSVAVNGWPETPLIDALNELVTEHVDTV